MRREIGLNLTTGLTKLYLVSKVITERPQGKAPKGPLTVHGVVGAANDLFDPLQGICGTSSICREILKNFLTSPA